MCRAHSVGFFLGIRMATSSTGTCPYANCPIISTERWALSRPSPIDYQFCILICPSRQCIEIELNKVTSSVSHCLFRPISVALNCRLFRSFAMASATGVPLLSMCAMCRGLSSFVWVCVCVVPSISVFRLSWFSIFITAFPRKVVFPVRSGLCWPFFVPSSWVLPF